MNDTQIFESEELDVWNESVFYGDGRISVLLELLNGEVSLEDVREDLSSFRNSKYYRGTNPDFEKIEVEGE